jgi:hypothetical protein
MTYIDLLNHFWRIDEQKGFNGETTRLYFFLLNLANRSFWNSYSLEYGDEKMRAYLGVSSNVLRTAREKLKEASLIDYVSGGCGHGVKTRYQILTPKDKPNPEPLYNKTKTKTNINNSNGKYSQREFIASGSDFD